jgi:MoaA/NifB/PqqE/SkfB family radical SAM enzyme
MLERLRGALPFRWYLARHGLGYSAAFLEMAYRIYVNHDKVIHIRDGYPVRSLSTPAAFSRPSANMLARLLFGTIQNRNLPNMLSLAVNDECDARCPHCSFFGAVADRRRTPLTTAQMTRVIGEAQALGVSVLNLVGGEPLLRDDLPALLGAVDKSLTTTIVFTNGSHLAERVVELRRAGLDSVYVSLDDADAAAHDAFRGVPGLHAQALAGVERAKRAGLSVGLSCTITPESFAAGALPRLVELGRRIGVHEVLVFDAMPTGRYRGRTDLVDNEGWVEEMIQSVAPFNADRRYPGVLVWAYTAGHRAVGCACGTSYFYISPYGDVMPCDFNHAAFGNVLERPLYQLWDELTSRDEYHQSKWGGCKVKDSAYRALPSVATGPARSAAGHPPATVP